MLEPGLQTPSWPSVEHAYRLGEVERAEFLPSIPVQPVGYSDAWQLLSRLEGEAAPASWQGGLNITYRSEQNKIQDNTCFA